MLGWSWEVHEVERTSWPPEHCDALHKHLAAGLTFSKTVKAINRKFGTAYTRSAAIGRARRMGLVGSDRPRPSAEKKPLGLERIVVTRPVEPASAALLWPRPPLKTQRPLKLRCAEVEPRHLSLIALERGDCRYPYGGDDESEAITFCGLPGHPGSSYCRPHFLLSRNPLVETERESGDAAAWLRVLEGV